jgi:FkbM family methyltransferase
MTSLKEKIIRLFIRLFYKSYYSISYSQEGEDLILRGYFNQIKKGVFVDIGAHHPVRFSNTYLLYMQGWSGINIDAMPGSMASFNKIRKRDFNLEYAISDIEEELTYFAYNEPALNGFSKDLKSERDGKDGYKVISEYSIKTKTLEWILDTYLEADQTIDLMTVDVEGFDLKVLSSNNWEKYSPTFMVVEDLDFDINNPKKSEMFNFLVSKGYNLTAKTKNNLIFSLKK